MNVLDTNSLDLSSVTIGQWQARQIEKCAAILSHFVETMPEDKLRWRPATDQASQTRTAMEQVGECIYANQRFLSYLTGAEWPPMPDDWDSFGSVHDAT